MASQDLERAAGWPGLCPSPLCSTAPSTFTPVRHLPTTAPPHTPSHESYSSAQIIYPCFRKKWKVYEVLQFFKRNLHLRICISLNCSSTHLLRFCGNSQCSTPKAFLKKCSWIFCFFCGAFSSSLLWGIRNDETQMLLSSFKNKLLWAFVVVPCCQNYTSWW